MCWPSQDVREFGERINECVLDGKVSSIPKYIANFEKKGFTVFYQVIPKDIYLKKDFFIFWDNVISKSSNLILNKSYRGILTITPAINKKNFDLFAANKNIIRPAHDYIWETSFKIHGKCLVANFYNKKEDFDPKDENIYVIQAYSDKNGGKKNAKSTRNR